MTIQLTAHQQGLIAAAFAPRSEALQAWLAWNEAVELDNADGFAYGLMPRIYRNLSGARYQDEARLKGIYRRTLTANLTRCQAYAAALALIAQEADRPVLLGRAGALLGIEQGLGTFELDSFELLVPPHCVQAIWRALTAGGWQASRTLYPTNVDHILTYHHALAFRQPQHRLDLRILWQLRPHTRAPAFADEAMPVHVAGTTLYAPAPHHQIVDLAWPREGRSLLQRTLDTLIVAAERRVEWDRLLAAGAQLHYQLPLRETLENGRILAPNLIPQDAMTALARQPLRTWQRLERFGETGPNGLSQRIVQLYADYQRAHVGASPVQHWRGAAPYLRSRWRRPNLRFAAHGRSGKRRRPRSLNRQLPHRPDFQTASPSQRGPTFVCIGPPKTGTTWLYTVLAHHPDVWLPPVKELNFLWDQAPDTVGRLLFSTTGRYQHMRRDMGRFIANALRGHRDSAKLLHWYWRYLFQPRTATWYAALFEPAGLLMTGDISPHYYFTDESNIAAFARHFPDTRIIVLLRNPLEREWSYLKMMRNLEKHGQAVPADYATPEAHAIYHRILRNKVLQLVDYDVVIQRWQQHFANVFVGYYDDLAADSASFVGQICDFLGLDVAKIDWDVVWRRSNVGEPLPMPAELEQLLIARHRPQIERMLATEHEPYARKWLEELDRAASRRPTVGVVQ